ncbi:sulfate/molybdate ABC transporter ATP-binding protein [Agromyces ramosus]|uniref:Molybdate transport system ATP-binding protein n=1 Tax=Agromyces ramosus TaxID=33879 RepID=A0ABU0RDS5_9MICO|nr:ATP-binding cassette domain-containing protein [Agromyces ramosus]MDQ0895209.1 molybdate transport system ATP-binding protein [Agromyces ramosus]
MTGSGASTGAGASAGLEAAFTATVGSFTVEAELAVAPGEIVAVLGPNGAGKSTLLAAIAGHLAPPTGFVRVGGRDLARRRSDGSLWEVPLERRRVGLLGQQPLLFPHLSALENVAFGPRAQGGHAAASRRTALRRLEEVGLADLAERRPAELSGGQQQRVAIARALAARPELLLLDEPFASLDVQTASDMRRLIATLPGDERIPTLLVTHDPLDAIVLARRAAILHDGRIVQQGATAEVLGHPATPFVAALAGVNLAAGVGSGDDGVAITAATGDSVLVLRGVGERLVAGRAATAVFSPASVHVRPAAEGAAAASAEPSVNRWIGTVALLRPAPGGVRIMTAEHPDLAVDVPSAAAVSLDLAPGARLAFTITATDVSVRVIA